MPDVKINIRQATASDFAAMKAILQDTFESTWQPEITPTAASRYIETDIGGRFVDEHGLKMFVAEIDDRVAGLIDWHDDFVDAVHVAKTHQGFGVGRALMTHAEQGMHAAGFRQSRLETDTFNERSHAVYRSLGYVETDRYPDDEWDSGFTTILFVKPLG